MRAKLKEVKEERQRRIYGSICEHAEWLRQVVTGFFQYHAVPTNTGALRAFRHQVIDLWRRTLRRRGQKHRMTWVRIGRFADHWLPKPHVRFCAGGSSNGRPVMGVRTAIRKS